MGGEAMNHFVALRKGKYGKILSATRHITANCAKIPIETKAGKRVVEVKEFRGGHSVVQTLAFKTRPPKKHRVAVAYCSRCFSVWSNP